MASSSEDVESTDPSFIIFDQCIGCIEEIVMSKRLRLSGCRGYYLKMK